MIHLLDLQVGEIRQKLVDLGLEKNTLILFTSDNGPHKEGGADPVYFNSNAEYRGYKRDLYEGGIRVPLIAYGPGLVRENIVSDHVCAFWDYLATICELIQIDSPKSTDGISFLPELKGEKQKSHDHLYWEFHEKGGKQAVRWGNWKGIRQQMNNNIDAEIELYDLSTDIGEQRNLAKKYPEVVLAISEIMSKEHTQSKEFQFEFEK